MHLLPELPEGGRGTPRAARSSTVFASALALTAVGLWSLAVVRPLPAAAAPVMRAVEVRGAQFIPEADIQATCGVEPGIDYWDEELRAIESCLMLTGVFETVTLTREGDVLVIEVVELNSRPGRVEASLQWDSEAGGMAGLSFERYNLLPDIYGALSLSYNAEAARLKGSLYRADAFGETLDWGLDLHGTRSDYDDAAYAEEGARIEPYLTWTPSPGLRAELGLGYRGYRMFDVDPAASPLLRAEETDWIEAPYLRASLEWRTPEPDQGQAAYAARLTQYAWNLGSGEALLDSRIALDARWPLGADTRLLAGLDAGDVWGAEGNDTRAIDRFYPGAASFRGFAPRGLGPRDAGDALGGTRYAVATLEVQHDVTVIGGRPLRGGVFVDMGGAWGLENTLGGTIDDEFHLRSSAGLSVSFDVGEVPVSLFVATPIKRQDGDRSQAFGISVAAQF